MIIFLCIFGARSPKMMRLTSNYGGKLKNVLSALALLFISSTAFSGGQGMSDPQGNSMSAAKASSGVHCYGTLYIGYDSTTGDTARLDDGGNKSRLGLKIKSGNIVGNLEYKYDKDFTKEQFYDEFGDGATFPQVTFDHKHIGGCKETLQYLQEKKML